MDTDYNSGVVLKKQNPGSVISLSIKFLIIFASIIISLIFAVIFSELFRSSKLKGHDENTQFDSHLGWSAIPSRSVSYEWGKINSNSYGFRSAEIDSSKPQVLVIGDSVAWGYGVSDDQTFPYFLEKELQGRNVQVDNLAVSGYGIDQYFLTLEKYIDVIRPIEHIIVVVCTRNDLINTSSNNSYGKRKPVFVLSNSDLELHDGSIDENSIRNFISKNFILHRLSVVPGIGRLLGWAAGDINMDDKSTKLVVTKLFEKMADLSNSHAVKISFVLAPSRADFETKTEAHLWFETFFQKSKYEYLDYYDAMQAAGLKIDDLFSEDKKDKGHFSAQGNHLLAQKVSEKFF